MEQLTLLLFERMGLLLLITFILTRIPQFRYLLDRRMDWKTGVTFSLFFWVGQHRGDVCRSHDRGGGNRLLFFSRHLSVPMKLWRIRP